MSESMFVAAYAQMCDNLLALRKESNAAAFEMYVARRWSLSPTRATLLCRFALFSCMCRAEYLPVPDSPDNIAPLLSLPQKRWVDTWRMLMPERPVNAKQCKAFLERFNMGVRKKLPAHVLNGRRVRKAAETLAGLGDGEALVDQIGVKGLGKNWESAVTVVIDADQSRMNKL